MKKKLFVVSDIHGHYTLLKNALDKAGYDSRDESHVLICCGDYFDRGSENVEVLRFFQRQQRAVLLRGNHEDLLLKLLHTGKLLPHHYINGTLETVKNFFGPYAIDPATDIVDFSGHTGTVNWLTDFICQTVDYYETEDHVFVHGWLPENCATAQQRNATAPEAWEKARWTKWTQAYTGQPPLADKTLVCGHMPTFFADPFDPERPKDCADIFYGNGLIAIDAGTRDSGQVNVLVLDEETGGES